MKKSIGSSIGMSIGISMGKSNTFSAPKVMAISIEAKNTEMH